MQNPVNTYDKALGSAGAELGFSRGGISKNVPNFDDQNDFPTLITFLEHLVQVSKFDHQDKRLFFHFYLRSLSVLVFLLYKMVGSLKE